MGGTSSRTAEQEVAAARADLDAARAETVTLIAAVPDDALTWEPGDGAWSLRQLIAHLAHSHDFYLALVEEAQASRFTAVRLGPDLAGFPRVLATDAAMLRHTGVTDALAGFEEAYRRLSGGLDGLGIRELTTPIALCEWQSAEATTTTILDRVARACASHLREHQAQLTDAHASWRRSRTGKARTEFGTDEADEGSPPAIG